MHAHLPFGEHFHVEFEITSERGNRDDERQLEISLQDFWHRIPADSRDAIGGYWKRPVIFLCERWWGVEGGSASVKNGEALIEFHWKKMCKAPHWVVECTLAHELAHVLQFATGKDRFALTIDDISEHVFRLPYLAQRLRPENLVEIHADETIKKWGYDPFESLLWEVRYLRFDRRKGNWIVRRTPRKERQARRDAMRRQDHAYYSYRDEAQSSDLVSA